ncbi:MAG TPA: hypothetical protein VKI61_08735 [Chitinophagaceae bacterium]|jgi:hypothetical protein|nr:hypothetical protein [Chitinophagaceae bacterium]
MKKALFIFSVLMASATFTFAQGPRISIDVIIGNRAPAPNEVNLMSREEAKHPNIAKSMHDIEDAMKHLHEAPDDFGGHKGQAETDLKQAWVSLRKALYFRVYEDRR